MVADGARRRLGAAQRPIAVELVRETAGSPDCPHHGTYQLSARSEVSPASPRRHRRGRAPPSRRRGRSKRLLRLERDEAQTAMRPAASRPRSLPGLCVSERRRLLVAGTLAGHGRRGSRLSSAVPAASAGEAVFALQREAAPQANDTCDALSGSGCVPEPVFGARWVTRSAGRRSGSAGASDNAVRALIRRALGDPDPYTPASGRDRSAASDHRVSAVGD